MRVCLCDQPSLKRQRYRGRKRVERPRAQLKTRGPGLVQAGPWVQTLGTGFLHGSSALTQARSPRAADRRSVSVTRAPSKPSASLVRRPRRHFAADAIVVTAASQRPESCAPSKQVLAPRAAGTVGCAWSLSYAGRVREHHGRRPRGSRADCRGPRSACSGPAAAGYARGLLGNHRVPGKRTRTRRRLRSRAG